MLLTFGEKTSLSIKVKLDLLAIAVGRRGSGRSSVYLCHVV